MTAGSATHATIVAVDELPEVAVGADFLLAMRVSCPAGCDLSGVPIQVTGPDGVAAVVALASGEAGIGEAREIALKAPLKVGQHIWRLSCPAHGSGGVHHEAGLLPVTVRTRPHETSLAVWGLSLIHISEPTRPY